MELLEKKIKEFLYVQVSSGNGSGYGYGYGYSYGYGSGSGDGDGFGSGFGYGSGSGDGDGFGSGFGSGYGSGDGDGFGSGFGSGYGSGDGDGDGDGLKSINGYIVYKIDGVQTIITNIKQNIAKGKIVKKDLTFEDCYIAKGQNMFAHGKTLREAVNDLNNKIFSNLDIEEKIEEFKKYFNNQDKYKGTEFYKWHNLLTGSCKMGRDNFVQEHGINLENMFTVKEFINLCKNDYGGEIIKKLEEKYENM